MGLAMAVGVLLLAVSSFVGGADHGIGGVITSAIKSAVQRAAGGGSRGDGRVGHRVMPEPTRPAFAGYLCTRMRPSV